MITIYTFPTLVFSSFLFQHSLIHVGIGFETAKSIASMKPRKLILACRNAEKAKVAVDTIQTATNFHDIEAWSLDLVSFASTQAFAKKFLDSGMPLDILVSNAGVGAFPDWIESDDGYEVTYVFFLLSSLLLFFSLLIFYIPPFFLVSI